VSAVSLPQAADSSKSEARKIGRIRMNSMIASLFVVKWIERRRSYTALRRLE
jgi:hypothetical protein